MYAYFGIEPFVIIPSESNLKDVMQKRIDIASERVKAGMMVLIVLDEFEAKITELKERISDLKAMPMCGGSLEHRAGGAVLATHSTGCQCPYPGHGGQPKLGRGVRRYVRKGDLEQVIEAQARYSQHQQLERELFQLLHGHSVLLEQLIEVEKTAELAVLRV